VVNLAEFTLDVTFSGILLLTVSCLDLLCHNLFVLLWTVYFAARHVLNFARVLFFCKVLSVNVLPSPFLYDMIVLNEFEAVIM
jgi:hypothetical protein